MISFLYKLIQQFNRSAIGRYISAFLPLLIQNLIWKTNRYLPLKGGRGEVKLAKQSTRDIPLASFKGGRKAVFQKRILLEYKRVGLDKLFDLDFSPIRKGHQQFQRTDLWGRPTLVLLILIAGISTSFQTKQNSEPPKITKEQLRQERLQKRLSEFQKSIERNCREDIMLRASEMVDSILIARAKASRDTIAKPPRPERPTRPEFRSPTDSTPIAPLLKNNDTL